MKAISFLGPARYQPTIYCYDGKEIETPFFAEALPCFFPEVEQLLVLLTPTVQAHDNWAQVRARLGDLVAPVPIPEGRTESELWDIFKALTEAVDEGETVVFDITHSFRSLPFLTFLAAAYLRAARQIKVHKIIYGAFEAKDAENHTPVFELTPFVGLLDWITATNQFIYTGDGRYLAHLLAQEGADRRFPALRKAGEQLQSFSLAMMLCRPLEVMDEAGKLAGALQRAEPGLARWTQPFGLLADRIQEEYADRALPDPTVPQNVVASLRQQFTLIRWYLGNNQIIQAMSLAREWVITAVGWRLGQGFVLSVKDREQLGHGVEGLSRLRNERCEASDLNEVGRQLRDWPESIQEALSPLWAHLTSVRNDLDHVGMNPGPSKAVKLARKAREEIWPRLHTLATAWDLSGATPCDLPTPVL